MPPFKNKVCDRLKKECKESMMFVLNEFRILSTQYVIKLQPRNECNWRRCEVAWWDVRLADEVQNCGNVHCAAQHLVNRTWFICEQNHMSFGQRGQPFSWGRNRTNAGLGKPYRKQIATLLCFPPTTIFVFHVCCTLFSTKVSKKRFQ